MIFKTGGWHLAVSPVGSTPHWLPPFVSVATAGDGVFASEKQQERSDGDEMGSSLLFSLTGSELSIARLTTTRFCPASDFQGLAGHIWAGIDFFVRDVRRNVNEISRVGLIAVLYPIAPAHPRNDLERRKWRSPARQ